MKKLATVILLLIVVLHVSAADKRYFNEKWFKMYQGSRNSNIENRMATEMDFLNYFYESNNFSDYAYFEVASQLNHHDKYILDGRLSIYNSLIPYCFNLSYNRLFKGKFGVIGGVMSNRFYLKEYNSFFYNIVDFNYTHRTLERQWNMNLFSIYTGPTFRYRYKTLGINLQLKTGVASFLPFRQKDILKNNRSNYKLVLDYQTILNFQPFVMPELELTIDFMEYKKAIIGGRFKFAHFYSRKRINYKYDVYEWTYDNPNSSTIKSLKHNLQHTDLDFGIFIRW